MKCNLVLNWIFPNQMYIEFLWGNHDNIHKSGRMERYRIFKKLSLFRRSWTEKERGRGETSGQVHEIFTRVCHQKSEFLQIPQNDFHAFCNSIFILQVSGRESFVAPNRFVETGASG